MPSAVAFAAIRLPVRNFAAVGHVVKLHHHLTQIPAGHLCHSQHRLLPRRSTRMRHIVGRLGVGIGNRLNFKNKFKNKKINLKINLKIKKNLNYYLKILNLKIKQNKNNI